MKHRSTKNLGKIKSSLVLLFLLGPLIIQAQESMSEENPPYYELPEAPADYTGAGVCARLIDGLGFRFYWASEGLREEDLNYKPSTDARSAEETIDHIYSLSRTTLTTIKGLPNVKTEKEEMTFEEKRRRTLEMLKEASDLLRKNPNLNDLAIVFQRGDSSSEYPFWNLINGPIADAIWHTGQLVSFRRASGNPYNSKASLFTGKVKE